MTWKTTMCRSLVAGLAVVVIAGPARGVENDDRYLSSRTNAPASAPRVPEYRPAQIPMPVAIPFGVLPAPRGYGAYGGPPRSSMEFDLDGEYRPRGDARDGSERFSSRSSFSGGHGALCVRTCDGYYFPAPLADDDSREAMCQASCPDGDPVLFQGSSVEDARNRSGKRYGDLPTAFLYRKERVAGCTCHRDPGDVSKRYPVLKDATLRPGDIVATEGSAVVFSGSRRGLPFKQADFVPIAQSTLLSAGERSRIIALVGQPKDRLLARVGKPFGAGAATGDDASDIVVRPGGRGGKPEPAAVRPASATPGETLSPAPGKAAPRIVLPRPDAQVTSSIEAPAL